MSSDIRKMSAELADIERNFDAIVAERDALREENAKLRQELDAICLREIADKIELGRQMQCNCDLDNWEPERDTGHSTVCRIDKAARVEFKARKAMGGF